MVPRYMKATKSSKSKRKEKPGAPRSAAAVGGRDKTWPRQHKRALSPSRDADSPKRQKHNDDHQMVTPTHSGTEAAGESAASAGPTVKKPRSEDGHCDGRGDMPLAARGDFEDGESPASDRTPREGARETRNGIIRRIAFSEMSPSPRQVEPPRGDSMARSDPQRRRRSPSERCSTPQPARSNASGADSAGGTILPCSDEMFWGLLNSAHRNRLLLGRLFCGISFILNILILVRHDCRVWATAGWISLLSFGIQKLAPTCIPAWCFSFTDWVASRHELPTEELRHLVKKIIIGLRGSWVIAAVMLSLGLVPGVADVINLVFYISLWGWLFLELENCQDKIRTEIRGLITVGQLCCWGPLLTTMTGPRRRHATASCPCLCT